MMALVDEYEEREEKARSLAIILMVCTLFLLAVNIYQFNLLNDKKGLEHSYMALEDRTSTLEAYYEELTGNYLSLRADYSSLDYEYSELVSTHYALLRDYDDIVNLRKEQALADEELIALGPGENHTLIYSLNGAGYVEVKYQATGEVFHWVGSSIVDGVYYSRIPSFPQTSRNGVFRVPAVSQLYLHVVNPDTDNVVEVKLSVTYVY
jgi:hypothetical protein